MHHINVSIHVAYNDYVFGQTSLQQGCTTRGPDPAPEGVLSGPRSTLKIYEMSSE